MRDVPVRLSVDDEDYDPSVGARLKLCLDGVDQRGLAHGYDLEAGTVTRPRLDDGGRIIVEGDQIAMETVRGVVTVEWIEG